VALVTIVTAIVAVISVQLALGFIAVAGVLAIFIFAFGFWRLRASLPLLDGELQIDGIEDPVRIDRDAAGVPLVSGASRKDVAAGLGFLHAQERFFQIDLGRRTAAGELAELLGKVFVAADRRARIHRFRASAEKIVASLTGSQREILLAYAAGVNAGLRSLRKAPFEYLLLRADPVEWCPEDTLLVVFYMYYLLQDHRADQDFNTYLLYSALPEAVADFLTPPGSPHWDAPLVGEIPPSPNIPGPQILDFRCTSARRDAASRHPRLVPGSNAWAVSGVKSGTGRAILANDMHLAFGMPPPFYRATLEITGTNGRRLSGVTLPGFPFLVAGTNGDVAWGLANASTDSVDLIRLDQAGLAPNAYRTPAGVAQIQTVEEVIRVRGGADDILQIQMTAFGPVLRRTRSGIQFAQLWTAHFPESVNLNWEMLEQATNVDEAAQAANRIGCPALTVTLADRHGSAGWTLSGLLPHRVISQKLPVVSSQAERFWDGWTDPVNYPRLGSPQFDLVWSANTRAVVDETFDRMLGRGHYVCGARASQIRNRLYFVELADEAAMHRIQRDDRALFLDRWHKLMLSILDHPEATPAVRESAVLLRDWQGHASAGSAAYRIVRQFRAAVQRLVFEPFVSLVKADHGAFDLDLVTDQLEEPLWKLVHEQPAHLLPPWFGDWRGLFEAAIVEVLTAIPKHTRLSDYVWGDENTLVMRHPMSGLFPLIGWLFDAPPAALDGDMHMPLSQTSRNGPAFRFVIAPGNEDAATLEMAGGQSANPLSRYYLAGHAEWLQGKAMPLLPGPPRFSLTLLPARPRGG